MIVNKNGRTFSLRTDKEEEAFLQKELESLNPDERETLEVMLQELKEKEDSAGLMQQAGRLEYKTTPVDMKTFVYDPYYLGHTCDNLYPKLLDTLTEVFEGGYQECILTGCIDLDAMVQASNGSLLTIREYIEAKGPAKVPSFSPTGQVQASTAGAKYTGRLPVLRMELANGMAQCLTPDHKILVCQDERVFWTPAERLQIGDAVVIPGKIETVPDSLVSISEVREFVSLNCFANMVPDSICRASNKIVSVFTSSLFEDSLDFVTASERFARQLQLLLLRQGKLSRLTVSEQEWTVTLCGTTTSTNRVEHVVAIKPVDTREVGDIVDVAGTRNFISNGIYSHNSIGFGKCVKLSNSFIVDLETGVRAPLQDFVGKTPQVPSLSEDRKNLVSARASKIWESGSKLCFKLMLESGRWLSASTDHPVMTPTGWVALESLKIGDLVATARTSQAPTFPLEIADVGVIEASKTRSARIPGKLFGLGDRQCQLLLKGLFEQSNSLLSKRHLGSMEALFETEELADDVQELLLRFGSKTRSKKVQSPDGWIVRTTFEQEPQTDPIVWDKVVRLENIGVHEVGDLTVPGTANAVCNGIVIHNTFTASIGICRVLYELSCMVDPHRSFGLAKDSNISIVCLSVSEMLATKVVFENIVTKIDASTYFRENFPFEKTKKELRFPNSVWVASRATTDTSALGLNTISGLVDECLHGDSLVTMANGEAIRAVDLHSTRKSFSVKTLEYIDADCMSPTLAVAEAFIKESTKQECFELDFEDGSILKVSGNHPVFVRHDSGTFVDDLVQAADLKVGCTVVAYDESKGLYPTKLTDKRAIGVHRTYDISVPGKEVFFADGILVHNTNFMPKVTGAKAQDPRFAGMDRAEVIYNAIKRRMKSRFEKFGKLPGVLFIMSSKATQDDFTARRINESKNDPSIYVADYCLTGDTKIPLLSGEILTLKELTNRYTDSDERFEVYSCDPETHTIVPGKAHHPRVTARNERVLKVTLDSGDSVRATASHPFMLRDGTYRRAGDLRPGDELMSIFDPKPEVASIEDGGVEDVYDLSVETYSNFAIDLGILLHNSLWDVKPEDYYNVKRFHVLAGNEQVPSRLLLEGEAVQLKPSLPEGCVILDVPEDFRNDFEKDLEGSIRDLGGISTLSVSPFIQRREKIIEAIDKTRKHPFSTLVYDASRGGMYRWELLVKQATTRKYGRTVTQLMPIISPDAPRHIHVDPSLRKDALGFCMAHISSWVDVIRSNPENPREKYKERAPYYIVDFMLRVLPPTGGEIILGDIRRLIYELSDHGFTITTVSMDSFNSADGLQQLAQKGYNALDVSVDVTPDPYDNLKTALYENRISFYEYEPVLGELRSIEQRWTAQKKRKIDHPPKKCFVGRTRIPLLDGTCPMIEELVGKEVWLYSTAEDGSIVPAKGRGMCSGEATELVDVVLDTGAVERCTPNHLWRLRDGSYKQAKDLRPGTDRLMPVLRQWPVSGGYEQVVDKTARKLLTHRMVWIGLNGVPSPRLFVHHKDHVKTNNDPSNLALMTIEEHASKHSIEKHASDKSWRVKLSEGTKRFNESEEGRRKHSVAMKRTMDKMTKEEMLARAHRSPLFRSDITIERLEPLRKDQNVRNANSAAHLINCGRNVVVRVLRENGYMSWKQFQESEVGLNHKVRAVIPVILDKPVPIYDLEVPNYSNFALSSGVVVHNSKDISDALAGCLWTLSQGAPTSIPLAPMKSLPAPTGDDAWLEEQQHAEAAGQRGASRNTALEDYGLLPPFLSGRDDPDDGGGWGRGGLL